MIVQTVEVLQFFNDSSDSLELMLIMELKCHIRFEKFVGKNWYRSQDMCNFHFRILEIGKKISRF